MSSVWDRFRTADDVRFRAACNDAIAEARRPIKRRVIKRLAVAPEPAAVWVEICARPEHQVASSGPDATQADAFFEDLVADRRWRVLVTEYVEAERQWADLRSGQFKRALEWVKAFLEKLGDPNHPVSKTAAAALAAGLSLGVSYKIVMAVSPVSQVNLPVAFLPAIDQKPIAIPLEHAGGVRVPLSFAAPTEPLQFEVQPVVGPVPAGVPGPVRADVERLHRTAERIASGVTETNKALGPEGSLARNVDNLTSTIKGLREIADSNAGGLRTMGERIDGIHASIAEGNQWSRQGQVHQLYRKVTLEEGRKGLLALSWVDRGRMASCGIDFDVTEIARSRVLLQRTGGTCPESIRGPLTLAKREDFPLGTLPFIVVVESIDRRLGRNRATVSVYRTQPLEPVASLDLPPVVAARTDALTSAAPQRP